MIEVSFDGYHFNIHNGVQSIDVLEIEIEDLYADIGNAMLSRKIITKENDLNWEIEELNEEIAGLEYTLDDKEVEIEQLNDAINDLKIEIQHDLESIILQLDVEAPNPAEILANLIIMKENYENY